MELLSLNQNHTWNGKPSPAINRAPVPEGDSTTINRGATTDSHVITGGFRLHALEVYNWGTFNQRIWRITPSSGTALVSGANGSGKSTLADALLTLLVPYGRRTYNQAAGREKHRERNEGTYVRGAWSKQKDRESNSANIQYLRGKDFYSVLLAVFANPSLDTRDKSGLPTPGREGIDRATARVPIQHYSTPASTASSAEGSYYLTLAQVFWWQQGELRKFFVIAPLPLNIEEHFSVRGEIADLRKQLRARGAEVFDEFAKYSRRFCHLMGLRSEKALDLFNQIVSIKDIGGLNAFVRDHMLEKTSSKKCLAPVPESFRNLHRSHSAMQLADRQLYCVD